MNHGWEAMYYYNYVITVAIIAILLACNNKNTK
jgi:hypothetical protein